MKLNLEKGNGLDAANDQPAKTLTKLTFDSKATRIGSFPTSHNTVVAEVLRRLLSSENLTSIDAVFDCSTTRLSAVIHHLAGKYSWAIDHFDKDVGTNDGRVTSIRAYFLPRHAIQRAFETGATEFCKSVKVARAATRKNAANAKVEAHKNNAARRPTRLDPRQGSLFGGQYE